jgi:rhodanese-related sulfurtransferase/predicted metal-dependent enzyme (double-stranded beta helix superfamily)
MTSLVQQRADAVRHTLLEVRRIAPDAVISDDQLAALKAPLIALAQRAELFPAEQFACSPGKAGNLYELSVDGDLRYALYASAGVPGKAQPPHNHTTWALISGVFGDEHNVGYQRTSETTVEKRWELTCKRGNAVAFQPDDFHTIEVTSSAPALHLHLYGRSLAHLPDRVFIKDKVDGQWSGVARRFMAKPDMYSPYVSAAELRAMLSDGEELALLDVREGGIFAQSHLLTACSLPLSQLELEIPHLLPRKSVRVVLIDDSLSYVSGAAQHAAGILRRHGYLNLSVLNGGVAAWGQAGYELFSGTFVPSKAFGEVVEHQNDTPRIDAEVLKQWQDEGRKMVLLDSRPMDEYKMMSIPGAADCPGAELVFRLPQLVNDDDTTVVVNCAGRTRSIIGAQSLRNAGFKNPIYALKNGTMGWHLAGLKVAKGADNLAPEPTGEALARAQQHAMDVANKYGVQRVSRKRLAQMQADDTRTTYLFDVRLPLAYRAGHLAGSVNAPGGQLVQSTDIYAPVNGARIVLIDEHRVQAIMTAHWLLQMGWREVFVLIDAVVGAAAVKAGIPQETGKGLRPGLGQAALNASELSPVQLKAELDAVAIEAASVKVIDVGASLKYRKSRIPGAYYAIRSRLGDCLSRFSKEARLVFVCSDGRLSRYAASDALALGFAHSASLSGGTEAWKHSGHATEASEGDADPKLLTSTDDVWYKPYDKSAGVEQAMLQYLTWEVNLVDQLKREPYLKFALQV